MMENLHPCQKVVLERLRYVEMPTIGGYPAVFKHMTTCTLTGLSFSIKSTGRNVSADFVICNLCAQCPLLDEEGISHATDKP